MKFFLFFGIFILVTSLFADVSVDLTAKEASVFSRNIEKETIIDNTTQFMWQDNLEGKAVKRNYVDAINYCENLSLAGFDDWRLPTIDEMLYITDITLYNPAIDRSFVNVVSSFYWSLSIHANDSSVAWGVSFINGSTGSYDKSLVSHVMCVRHNNDKIK